MAVGADVDGVAASFRSWAQSEGLPVDSARVVVEVLAAPHRPSRLPAGYQGVYAFRYQDIWLKVGKAGPNSNARWQSHHYSVGSSMSNLAWSLTRYAFLAESEDPRLPAAIKAELRASGARAVKRWIQGNTDRVNLLLDAGLGNRALAELENTALAILKPVFEGPWKYGGPSP